MRVREDTGCAGGKTRSYLLSLVPPPMKEDSLEPGVQRFLLGGSDWSRGCPGLPFWTLMATSPSSSLALPAPPFGANSSPPSGVRAGVARRGGAGFKLEWGHCWKSSSPPVSPLCAFSKHCALYLFVLSLWRGVWGQQRWEDSTQVGSFLDSEFRCPHGDQGRGIQAGGTESIT